MTERTTDDGSARVDGTRVDQAAPAEVPGVRQDAEVDPLDREPTLEVDAGSPQDVGEPNEGVVRD